jgi:hypothetical protein
MRVGWERTGVAGGGYRNGKTFVIRVDMGEKRLPRWEVRTLKNITQRSYCDFPNKEIAMIYADTDYPFKA